MVGRAVLDDPTDCYSYSSLYKDYMNDADLL